MTKQGRGRLPVVLVPCPFQGHINPMLQLGGILHSKGFSITVVHAKYNSPNPSSHPNFHFLALPDTSPVLFWLAESWSQNPVPELYPLRFKDLPKNIFGKLENYLQLLSNVSSSEISSAIIYNTIDSLEHSSLEKIQQLYQVPIFPLGPIHKISSASCSSLLEEDTSCLAWLDNQSSNSVIYISLGSIASMDLKELVEMAWGLANSQQPFLWVVRPGSVLGAEWLEELPEDLKENIRERSYIAKWAPQKEVLAHEAVGGFLSHCGWNSTLESICEGVPVICRPCFGDQKVNARYVSHVWRVGLELEGELERVEIETAVRRLMVDEEGVEMRERAKNLKETIELCTTDGGTSNNSLNQLLEMIMSF